MEPANLHEWAHVAGAATGGRLFTCGRPGRATFGRARQLIHEDTIHLWVMGLPKVEPLYVVSLLGKKKDDFSEFAYYPFRSSTEIGSKPTFQQWLEERYPRLFRVSEFPTIDAQGIPADVLAKTRDHVLELVAAKATVVVIDSAGAERTARVCESAGYERNPAQPSNRIK